MIRIEIWRLYGKRSSSIAQLTLSASSQLVDQLEQCARIDWLGHVSIEAGFSRSFLIVEHRVTGNGHHRNGLVTRHLSHLTGQLITVHLGHADVRDDHVKLALACGLECRGRRSRCDYRVTSVG